MSARVDKHKVLIEFAQVVDRHEVKLSIRRENPEHHFAKNRGPGSRIGGIQAIEHSYQIIDLDISHSK